MRDWKHVFSLFYTEDPIALISHVKNKGMKVKYLTFSLSLSLFLSDFIPLLLCPLLGWYWCDARHRSGECPTLRQQSGHSARDDGRTWSWGSRVHEQCLLQGGNSPT